MKKTLFLILFALTNITLFAQNPADVDFSFEYSALNGRVNVTKIQSDGKILVGGEFTNYGNKLTRFNSDGSKDITFNIGTGFYGSSQYEGNVQFIEIQSDGKILVGGYFTSYNGQSFFNLIRLNSDGSIDSAFNTGIVFANGAITSIAIQQDGKILVAGDDFTTYNGLIRLNSDGSNDTTFNIGTGFNNNIYSIAIQQDGKIIVGGDFTTYNGLAQNRLIRLNSNGSKDSGYNIFTAFNNTVYSLLIQSDGKILVGGDFTTFQGTSSVRLIRLETYGSRDFMFGVGTGFDNIVRSIGVQSDGKILVGGDFTTYNGQPQGKLISLNATGSKNTAFNIGTSFNNIIRSITIQSDNTILVGGDFTSYNGQTENRLIGLNSDGSKNTTFKNATGFNQNPQVVKIQQDGKILVGGRFTTYKGLPQNCLIRLNSDGSKDDTFVIGTGFSGTVHYPYITSIIIQPDGKILVGGQFVYYNGQFQHMLIRLNSDGSKDTTFNLVIPGFDNNFNNSFGLTSIAIQQDSKILVGGNFSTFNGQSQNGLIRLNSDGSKDTTFNIGTGFNGSVNNDFFISSINIQSDSKILIGGYFTNFNGQSQNYLIRLNSNGSKDTAFDIGTGFNGTINSIAIQSDGKILTGGNFSTFNGQSQNRIMRLNSDGSKDITFNIGAGFDNNVNSIGIQSDNQILVGGAFTTFNGLSQNGLILLNTDGSKDNTYSIGVGFTVLFMAIQPDGKIVITGKYEGSNFIGLMRLMGDSALNNSSFSKNNISLYPNPVKEILNVSLSENTNIESYEIYDLIGKKVASKNTTENFINVSDLSNGIYVLKVATNEGVITNKFIKE